MRATILGRNGFIGKALWEKFKDETLYSYPRKDVDYIFFFSSPSSQILFKHAPEYCYSETVINFINILEYCAQNNIKLIYPSTQSTDNEYADCKRELENIQEGYSYKNVLGLRISAGYGNEESKGEYASVVYQFIKTMKAGKRPIIFGDGNQTRDFIYVKDLVDAISDNLDKTGLIDIGSGIPTSFNDLVEIINQELKTNISPLYVDKPASYLQDATSKTRVKVNYSLREGIREICESL